MNNQNKVFLVVLFLTILIPSVCFGQQKAKWRGTVEEEDGIKIIRNPKKPIYTKNVLQLEEDLVIMSPDDEELMFQTLTFLAVDDEENIYVSDSKAGHILVFDNNGDFVRKIGKRGQGPGEMIYPFEVLILAQKELMVNDIRQAKVHFFTLDGEFIKQMTTSKMPAFRRPKADSKGNIVVGYAITGEPIMAVLKKFDSELKPQFELASLVTVTQPPVIEYFEIRRTTNLVWNITKDDEIIWGDFKKYEIHVCNPEGECIRKIIKEYDGMVITKEEEEKLIKDWIGDRPVPDSITLKFPKCYPPFIRFTCDEEGRIFVQTYEKTEDEEKDYYDVFDSEGKYIARITFRFRPQIWKNKMMYCVEEDEEGFQVIKRYKVNWTI